MNLKTYTGYHGTDFDSAKRIKKSNYSINPGHIGWLGKGVYFFQDNLELAHEYASHRHKGKIIKVLKNTIEIDKNKIFDTTQESGQILFHDYSYKIKEKMIKDNISVKVSNRNDFDGKVYDIISEKEEMDLIRASTFTPKLIDRGRAEFSRSRVPNGIELCLKKVSCVKDREIVK